MVKPIVSASQGISPMRLLLVAITLGLTSTCADAAALTAAQQRGQAFARANCGGCHSIDGVTPSPLAIAPPFRSLHLKYPIEMLEEALAEGITTGHPTMPEFRLDPAQINDLISFLKRFEKR